MNQEELSKVKYHAAKNNFKYLYDAIQVYENHNNIGGFIRALQALEVQLQVIHENKLK